MPAWVFLTPDGNPVDGDNLRHRVFYRLMERAELRRIRFHDLRHTFASLLIQQGESPVYVQEQLGHSSIQVTVDVYGHLIPGANRDAVDRLDAHPTRIPGASETDESDDDFPQVVETNGAGERTRTADLLITKLWQTLSRTDQTASLRANPDHNRSGEDATFGSCRTFSHTDDASAGRLEGWLPVATYRLVGTRAWSLWATVASRLWRRLPLPRTALGFRDLLRGHQLRKGISGLDEHVAILG